MIIDLEGQKLDLRSDGSMYWVEANALILADVHLGKANHFRKNGIAIPLSVQQDNYQRLISAFDETKPDQVFILGDLFHSQKNKSWELFEALIRKTQARLNLILGNHDIIDELEFKEIGVEVHPEGLEVGPFELRHHPVDNKRPHYVLCGHVHPAVKLRGKGRQSIRLKCFHFSENQGILPAFGAFTGMHSIKTEKGDSVYALSENSVIKKQ